MPNTKMAAKRMRQNSTRRAENRARKTAIKTYTKKILQAVEQGEQATAQDQMAILQKKVDKAAKHGTIHPNKAARRKSRMQKRINKLSAGS